MHNSEAKPCPNWQTLVRAPNASVLCKRRSCEVSADRNADVRTKLTAARFMAFNELPTHSDGLPTQNHNAGGCCRGHVSLHHVSTQDLTPYVRMIPYVRMSAHVLTLLAWMRLLRKICRQKLFINDMEARQNVQDK